MMTKKNFITLADAIRAHDKKTLHPNEYFTNSQIAVLADFCAAQNPNFNRERWLDYIAGNCGASGGKVAKK